MYETISISNDQVNENYLVNKIENAGAEILSSVIVRNKLAVKHIDLGRK